MVKKVDIHDLITSHGVSRVIWECRCSIVEGIDTHVPSNLYDFFKEYSEKIEGGKVISLELEVPIYYNCVNPLCVMYSGGAESSFMSLLFDDADKITGYNFFDFNGPKEKREFQLALAGLSLGYAVTMIGIGSLGGISGPFIYEYTPDFFHLWNRTFPGKIHTPLKFSDKDFIYETLFREGIKFNWCEKGKDSESFCGECWKCLEAFCVIFCLKKYNRPEVRKFFRSITLSSFNTHALSLLYEEANANRSYDPCGTFATIIHLEEKYGEDFKTVFKGISV